MQRIISHWTAGTHTANAVDRRAYHFLIQGDGSIAMGDCAPEDNLNVRDGKYAAHTRGCNTGSIGVAFCAMAGAVERPFNAGRYPITAAQISAWSRLVSALAERYRIPITRQTVLTHAEVQPTLGIQQRNKWDIVWLPGMTAVGNAIEVGDRLRAMVKG